MTALEEYLFGIYSVAHFFVMASAVVSVGIVIADFLEDFRVRRTSLLFLIGSVLLLTLMPSVSLLERLIK